MNELTTKEASVILGVSRRRVIALIEQGKLKARKFSNIYIIAPNDLEAVRDRKNGRPETIESQASESVPFVSFYDVASKYIGSIEDGLPEDLSTNKKYLEGMGKSRSELNFADSGRKRKR